jgi:hypothetical protein
MKRLHSRVNLIPVIAKSDTMTDEEIMMFKRRVRSVGALLTISFLSLTLGVLLLRSSTTSLTTTFKSSNLPLMTTRRLWPRTSRSW